MQPRRTIGALVYLLLGPLLWAAHLTAVYGSQSSLCAFDVGETAAGANPFVSALIIAATLVCLGLIACAMWWPRRVFGWLVPGEPPLDRSFLTWVMRALSALAALAILYAGVAAIVLPACAQLR